MSHFPISEGRPEEDAFFGGYSVMPSFSQPGKIAIWLEPVPDGEDLYFSPEMTLRFADALREVAEYVLAAQEPVKPTKTVTIKRMINRELVVFDIQVPINKENSS